MLLRGKDYSLPGIATVDSGLQVRMTDVPDDDQWLGTLRWFPTVLHARASFSLDFSSRSFQKALFAALRLLHASSRPMELTVADRNGYENGRLHFKIGIGNCERFDILDAKEEQRLLSRVENLAPFNTLDLAFHIRYTIDDDRNHKLRQDHCIMRLVFQPGMFEVLVHHVKGMRRVQPGDLVRIVLEELNDELDRENLSRIKLDVEDST
jgi:hypothetical protein